MNIANPQELESYYNSLSDADKETFIAQVNKLSKNTPSDSKSGKFQLQQRLLPLIASTIIGIIAGIILWILFRNISTISIEVRAAIAYGVVYGAVVSTLLICYRKIKLVWLFVLVNVLYVSILIFAALPWHNSNFMEFWIPTQIIVTIFAVGIANFSLSNNDFRSIGESFSGYIAKFIEVVTVSAIFYAITLIVTTVGIGLLGVVGFISADLSGVTYMMIATTMPLIALALTYDFSASSTSQTASPIIKLISYICLIVSFIAALFLSCYIVFIFLGGFMTAFNSGASGNIFMATIIVAMLLIYLSNLALENLNPRLKQVVIVINTVLTLESLLLNSVALLVTLDRLARFSLSVDRIVALTTIFIYFVMLLSHSASVGWLIVRKQLASYLSYLRIVIVIGLTLLAGFVLIYSSILDLEYISAKAHIEWANREKFRKIDRSYLQQSPVAMMTAFKETYSTLGLDRRVDVLMTINSLYLYNSSPEQKAYLISGIEQIIEKEADSKVAKLGQLIKAKLNTSDYSAGQSEQIGELCLELMENGFVQSKNLFCNYYPRPSKVVTP